MSRCIVLFVFCTFLYPASIAQPLGDEPEPPPLRNGDLHSPSDPGARSGRTAEPRISITRLREPPKAQQLYNQALNAWAKQLPAEAQGKLDKALRIYPTFPEALTFYAGIQASLGQWNSAEQKLQAAIQIDSTYSPAYLILAGVYNTQQRFDDAQQAIQQARSAGADNWLLQYEIARILIGKRQYESALETTELALRSTPHQALLHLAKAHALLGLRKYPQAATELSAYLRNDPSGNGSQQARDLLRRIQAALSGDASSFIRNSAADVH